MVGMVKQKVWISLVLLFSLALVLASCTSSKGKTPDSSVKPSETAGANKEATTKPPTEMTKLRVMLYDRGNAPQGMKLNEAPMIKWAQEEVKKLGIDLEYALAPRAEAETKLTTWLSSGDSPDIIFTYDINTLFRYAGQGGLWELDDLVNKYGSQIKKNNNDAMYAGVYKNKRYAVPAINANTNRGQQIIVRQDWLDKLNMKSPTNLDEFYKVLKAFKEQDPGNVGKANVIPFAFPAVDKSFMYVLSGAFGMNPGLLGNGIAMYGGVWEKDQFVSNIASKAGHDFLLFMNKLYKEGLISKEFATDVNQQQMNQQIATGVAGFVESNDSGWATTLKTMPAVPNARWMPVALFPNPDGVKKSGGAAKHGMFSMVPKSSKEPQAIAAIKYLNWMADPKVIETLQFGIEGVHWKMVDGIRAPIDPAKNAKEVSWYSGDMSIIQGGQPQLTYDQLLATAKADSSITDPTYYAKVLDTFAKIHAESAPKKAWINAIARPFAAQNQAAIATYLNEMITKLIVTAGDPEAVYTEMIAGWKKLGGDKFDKEMTDTYKEIGFTN